jgi:hypothetical protein
MQVKRIQGPQCGVVLDVKNSKNEAVKQITCPSCNTVLQVKFAPQNDPIEAHTYYAPKTNKDQYGKTELASPSTIHKSACLIYGETTLPLELGDNIIGRKGQTSKASVQIATDDRYLSRQHCRITITTLCDGTLKAILRDYQNKNMTFVNGQVIEQGDEIRLSDGCRITMGNTTVTFKFT